MKDMGYVDGGLWHFYTVILFGCGEGGSRGVGFKLHELPEKLRLITHQINYEPNMKYYSVSAVNLRKSPRARNETTEK